MLRGSLCTITIFSALAAGAQTTLHTRQPDAPQPAPVQPAPKVDPAAIPAGVPLRVQIDHTYSLKPGTVITGRLIAPVYRFDHQVLPANTPISGVIVGTHRVDQSVRTTALLDGDFTPLAVANIRFDSLAMPGGATVSIAANATERNAAVVRMAAKSKQPSLKDQAIDQIKQSKQDALDTITKPGKGDRVKRYLYAQLPYHPQRIWAGTEYDAELTAPVVLPEKTPAPLPLADLGGHTPTGRIEARLTATVDSRSAKQGDPVEAVLSKPLITSSRDQPGHQELELPEGTRLTGTVLRSKPAKWFARNGNLRFTFRQIELPEEGGEHTVNGQISAAEANSKQNVSIDGEGGAKAGPDKGKYLAPLALGVMAAASMDDDGPLAVKGGVVSNGFGVIARVVAISAANPSVSAGFAYFALAKSVYRRWIAKGKEVTFPKNTRLQIDLSDR